MAAELNRFPGPKHVLELADSPELSAGQREKVAALFEVKDAEAAHLGARLVQLERELEAAFATQSITGDELAERLEAVGQVRADLRFVQLVAYLDTTTALTPDQVAEYQGLSARVAEAIRTNAGKAS